MRIAFISWDDTIPEIGGYSSISMVSYQIALRLTRLGHEVIIYGKKGGNQPALEYDANDILHIRVFSKQDDLIRKPVRMFERLGIFSNYKRPLYASSLHSPGYVSQIAIDLKKRKPDIVHIHNFSQYAPIIRAFDPHAKIVLHMHCEWLNQLDRNMIEKRLGHIDMVIGCSDYISGRVSRRFPEYSNRCQTIYNGVGLSQFTKNSAHSEKHDTQNNLLFVGRVSPEKGLHVLLDAFGIVLKTLPDTHLQIVGGSGVVPFEFLVGISDDERVRDLEQFYQVSNSRHDFYYDQIITRLPAAQMQKVSFLDYVQHNKIQDIYHKADIFINSSLTEAFPLPILEAMASGVPVIAAEVGGVPEIVRHGETGLLFRPGDPVSLAESIIRLITEGNLRQRLKINAYQEIKRKYSWEIISEGLIHKYQSLLDA